jgi:hypothetical protein
MDLYRPIMLDAICMYHAAMLWPRTLHLATRRCVNCSVSRTMGPLGRRLSPQDVPAAGAPEPVTGRDDGVAAFASLGTGALGSVNHGAALYPEQGKDGER